jgi:hypothetical protein
VPSTRVIAPPVLVAAALVAGFAMWSHSRHAARQGREVVGSAQRPEVVDSVSPPDSVLLPYLHSLHFHSDHVLSDEQPLDWSRPSRQAARVEPVAMPGEAAPGGIVARMVNLADSVPRFGLATRGTTYIWIQRDPEPKYAMLITMDARGKLVRRTKVRVEIYRDPADSGEAYLHPRINQSLARWVFDPRSRSVRGLRTMAIGTCHTPCAPNGWCKADSIGSVSR